MKTLLKHILSALTKPKKVQIFLLQFYHVSKPSCNFRLFDFFLLLFLLLLFDDFLLLFLSVDGVRVLDAQLDGLLGQFNLSRLFLALRKTFKRLKIEIWCCRANRIIERVGVMKLSTWMYLCIIKRITLITHHIIMCLSQIFKYLFSQFPNRLSV